MIKKLESAGLGFYVKATESPHKLGKFVYYSLCSRALYLIIHHTLLCDVCLAPFKY